MAQPPSSNGNSYMAPPAHILIARHPRTSMTHASLSSPAETHAAAAGIFPRSPHVSISPPIPGPAWPHDDHPPPPNNHNRSMSLNLSDLDEIEFASPGVADQDSDSSSRVPIEVHSTFAKDARWPGTVKIVVEATTFWAHKDILVFASPFFEAALSGCWAETGRPASISSIITISQPPSVPTSLPTPIENASIVTGAEASMLTDSDLSTQEWERTGETDEQTGEESVEDHSNPEVMPFKIFSDISSDSDSQAVSKPNAKERRKSRNKRVSMDVAAPVSSCASSPTKERERANSLDLLQGFHRPSSKGKDRENLLGRKRTRRVPDAVVHLREEKATIFHDFLKFVYPHLECTITWYNVEGLMNISHKLVVPALQQKCLSFLLTHAAGKPIKAMRIAELFKEEELYREASRFVLENPGGWAEWEMKTLSAETLLKLEKRRNWFLERVIKLGLVSIAKEYQCCATCPEPTTCARTLDEKFRQNYHALFRFGPAQPSMVYRYLRSLEGVSPPLLLTQLSCQMFAKNWIASLFDRMFSLGVHMMAPLSGHGVVAAPGTGGAGPRRHFLFCTLKDEKEKKRTTSAAVAPATVAAGGTGAATIAAAGPITVTGSTRSRSTLNRTFS